MFNFPTYTLTNNGVAISTAITAIQLLAGSAGPCVLTRYSLTQGSSTTSTGQTATLRRKSAAATVTTGVSDTTVLKMNPASPTTNATLSTSGTGITASAEGTNSAPIDARGFNILNGVEVIFTPEERPIVQASGICGIILGSAVSATYIAQLTWMELRGA